MKMLNFVGKELWRMIRGSKGVSVLALAMNVLNAVIALVYTDALNKVFSAIGRLKWDGVIITAFLGLGVVILLQDILNGVVNYILTWQMMKVQKGYMASFFRKVDRLGAAQMQDPEILDILSSVRNGRDTSIQFMLHAELLVSYYLFYFIFLMAYLCRMHWLLALAVVATYIPSVLTYRLKHRISLKNEENMANYRRQRDAYCGYVTDWKFFKETRFWGVEGMFAGQYEEADKGYQKERIRGFRKQNGVGLFTNFTYVLGFGVVLSAILYLVRQQDVSAAEVATVLAIVISVYDNMDELMNSHIAGMAQSLSGLAGMHKLVEIVAEDEEIGAERNVGTKKAGLTASSPETGKCRLEGRGYTVELEQVCFAYPDAESSAVRNVDLHIEDGQLLAIVGENGSGKTTLSKILCGLYRPSAGSMKINGGDSKEIRRDALMGAVSVVFQDFNKYPLTVAENIEIADYSRQGEKDELDRLAELVDINSRIEAEKNGFDTLLSRKFGGVDWSGGLWQRLAIARAAYKKGRFLVFDEPTAAIDPLEELEIMKKMAQLAKGRTAVLVTHRIGAARLADRIIVMAHGSICETGTHAELLAQGGEYAKMYEAQKQWYI